MVLSVLFGKKYQKGKIGSVELDVTLREAHNYSSRVTTYPVEKGSIISDNIVNDPVRVVLEGIVTDTPLSILTTFNRSVDAFNRLIAIHNSRELVTLVTGLKVYESMAITNLNIPREVRTGQSLKFEIELQQVIIDSSVTFDTDTQNIFGTNQITIPEQIVSSGENIPFIQNDPVNSLKDQATSGIDFGIQFLQAIPTDVLTKVNQSLNVILGLV